MGDGGPEAPGRRSQREADGALPGVSPVWRILLGVLTVAAGCAVMVWPGRSLVAVGVIVGCVLLATALVEIWTAVAARDGDAGPRMLAVVVGLLFLVAGILCLRLPGATAVTLTLVLGIAWIVGGIGDIVRAVSVADSRLVTGIGGAVAVLAGIVVLLYPLASAAGLVWVIGAGLVVLGVVAVVRGVRARSSASRRVGAAPGGPAAGPG
jgi:hypothetical protein